MIVLGFLLWPFYLALAIGTKWLVIGRYRPTERPLWSGFVWRTELVTGVREAHGDWLLFIDSDTRHEPENVSVLMEYARREQADIAQPRERRRLPLPQHLHHFANQPEFGADAVRAGARFGLQRQVLAERAERVAGGDRLREEWRAKYRRQSTTDTTSGTAV